MLWRSGNVRISGASLSRIARLEAAGAEAQRSNRWITLVAVDDNRASPPGSIRPGKDDSVWLNVSEAFADDPVAGLSPDQRRFLRPGDRMHVHTEVRHADHLAFGHYSFVWERGLTAIPDTAEGWSPNRKGGFDEPDPGILDRPPVQPRAPGSTRAESPPPCVADDPGESEADAWT
jgi:hypothetical protein